VPSCETVSDKCNPVLSSDSLRRLLKTRLFSEY